MTTEERIVLYRAFIEAWQASTTTQEVAQKTGLTVRQVWARAAYLRSKRVELKIIRRNGNPIDKDQWERLRVHARNCADAAKTNKYRTVG